jgi:signal transduction histidine kinase
VKARYLAILFIAAVLVPSVLLSVLSIRSAGREEAYVEKQLATTLLAEVTHTASLVSTGVGALAEELHSSVAPASSSGYQRALSAWKKRNPLVGVPFLLSPGYGILWPRLGSSSAEPERIFLEQNSDFLSGKSATPVFTNIAVVHKEEVLAEARKLDSSLKKSAVRDRADQAARRQGAVSGAYAATPQAAPAAPEVKAATPTPEAKAATPGANAATPEAAPSAPESNPAASGDLESQQAIDTFAQSPAVQARVYERARQEGQQLNARVAQPTVNSLQAIGADATRESASRQSTEQKDGGAAQAPVKTNVTAKAASTTAEKAEPVEPAATGQPSQYITTPQFLNQIASQGEYGIIPRFVGDTLTFLFWNRQADGRIVGCQIATAEFRRRVAAILPSTYSPVRIMTVLDESGEPLAAPAGGASRDWRRPFVSQEIGPSLPRWEVASYLTDPGSIAAQARAASAVIWILVLILFVSVAGGGTMVLTSLYGEMRLAQKKASFVANVSHELKTPLTSISLFVDLLRRKRQPDPGKRDRYLAMMAAETERLGRLINNVLDFSSQEKGKKKYSMQAVHVGQMTEEVVEGQRVRLESLGFRVGFETRRPGDLPPVTADPEALKQVLINLLSNAEKYSPRLKEIDVEVDGQGPDVAVHVRDRGIGVAERDRERIFLEFVRVDDSLTTRVPGTGLGLTIARRIARDHGGELTCEGREGGGSDFILRLPAATSPEKHT